MIFGPDDISAEEPKPTALFAAAASAAVANSWTSVNGWSVARAYSSAGEEYEAARAEAVVADIGAVIRYTVRGVDAALLLARVASAPVKSLEPGESARGLILDAGGAVVDIVEVARLGPELYMMCASQPHARRLQLASRGFDAETEDITERVAALAVVGPASRDVVAAAGVELMDESHAAQLRVRGIEASARPIHHGPLPGIEIIYPRDEALTIWERIRRARAPVPAGLEALEILRIEGGAPRPGVDFVGADTARNPRSRRTPRELGLGHLAPIDRAWFNGRRALRSLAGEERRLAVLSVDASAVSPGAAVFGRKNAVGRITSCAFSPLMKRVVAFADLAADALGRPVQVAMPGEDEPRAAARLMETPESRLAGAAGQRATESDH